MKLPPLQFNIQMSLPIFHTPQFPSHIRIVRTSLLGIGNRLRFKNPTNCFLLNRIILKYSIGWKHYPTICSEIKLGKSQRGLVVAMKEDVFWYLVGYVERLFYEIGWKFEFIEDLRAFIVFFQYDIVYLL
jgi:hypothetical protein